jgi:hypothetical protein
MSGPVATNKLGFLYLMKCKYNGKTLVKIGKTSGYNEKDLYKNCQSRCEAWGRTAKDINIVSMLGCSCFMGGEDDAIYHEKRMHELLKKFNVKIENLETQGIHTEFFRYNNRVINMLDYYLWKEDVTLNPY